MFVFSDALLNWFDEHGRKDLPWQVDKTPYRVWVSEIMLQQTQVASVIGYYQRFMTEFPDVAALAEAEEDHVLANWAGLGYYARARNLHKAAKLVTYEFDGEFPDTREGLQALPGIGRSTAAAIMSIAYKQNEAILDGNVKRVLCRYYAINTWSGDRQTEKRLWSLAESLNPSSRCDDYTQAIMDLGATLCKRSKPDCERCPMKGNCEAYKKNLTSSLPVSKPKKTIPEKEVWLAHVVNKSNGAILLEKRPSSGIWGGLYSLPEISFEYAWDELDAPLIELLGADNFQKERLASFRHTFSHYHLVMHPILIYQDLDQPKCGESGGLTWLHLNEYEGLGFPAPIKKYLSRASFQPELELSSIN